MLLHGISVRIIVIHLPKCKMVISKGPIVPSNISNESDYNRVEEVKAFDETKAGVKGLVDSGLTKVPKMFLLPPNELNQNPSSSLTDFQIPIIDLKGEHKKVVDAIKVASEKWGFFQVVNHGIPLTVLEEMIKGVIRFNEQDGEVRKEFYTRDRKKRVIFNSNFHLYTSKAANWRDSMLAEVFNPDPLDPNELPAACRDITIEYAKHVTSLGDALLELLLEALGLKADHLKQMKCGESVLLVSHYYPACPEPELTLGTSKHTDAGFVTILLQDHIGGLQVLHQNHWVDVNPIAGALVVNIGDYIQITSNARFKSIEHRVLANHIGPRVSVACFLTGRSDMTIGPIKELIASNEGPVYRDISINEYLEDKCVQAVDGKSRLDNFKI
ncbi:hypothetical protein IFM89_030179 [Coptis chinensis]|uniref:Fe2OG dioxygenase domain-containing protein n=1 Tax=Coptis chinensis TaxID=261450 RepID=A0A835H0B6_9MAGN|nr:hypothetical protein IFM89_030179 [Coptis chinensis]